MDPEFDTKLLSIGQPAVANVSWVSMDGIPVQGGVTVVETIQEILSKENAPVLTSLTFCNPETFVAGGIHNNLALWEMVLQQHPERDRILSWLRDGVDILEFREHFSGYFKVVKYDSDFPPAKVWKNHASCRVFSEFISEAVLKRVAQGAVAVWGRVNVASPPYLVLPLTVELSKPRLCLDAQFLNLWMRESPFTLDKLVDVRRFLYKNSYISKCDDKSGYDHVLLKTSFQPLVGFEWSGWWFFAELFHLGGRRAHLCITLLVFRCPVIYVPGGFHFCFTLTTV